MFIVIGDVGGLSPSFRYLLIAVVSLDGFGVYRTILGKRRALDDLAIITSTWCRLHRRVYGEMVLFGIEVYYRFVVTQKPSPAWWC